MTRRQGPVLLLLVSAIAAACSLARTTPQLRYYTVTIPGDPPTLPAPIEVHPFVADDPYATARIAYRTSRYRIDYYTYHRWAADPANLLHYAVRDHFARANPPPEAEPFTLRMRVLRMEEDDTSDPWQGALALEAEVQRKGRLVFKKTFTANEPMETRTPEAVAAALSRALRRVLDRLVLELPTSTT